MGQSYHPPYKCTLESFVQTRNLFPKRYIGTPNTNGPNVSANCTIAGKKYPNFLSANGGTQ